MIKTEIEDIILVEVLDFKKPERAGDHCRGLAAKAASRILAALEGVNNTPDAALSRSPQVTEDAPTASSPGGSALSQRLPE